MVPMAASGAVDLPDKTVEELLEFAAASDVDALSGTIEQTSELGLPDLGGLMGSRTTRAQVPSRPPPTSRTSSRSPRAPTPPTSSSTASAPACRCSTSWPSATSTSTARRTRPGTSTARRRPPRGSRCPSDADLEQYGDRATTAGRALQTPDQMLDDALARLDETTEVTVGTDARVAGREVYELILAPRTEDTLVGELRFAIDGENGVALAASVTARGASEPAFEVAFSRVELRRPGCRIPDVHARRRHRRGRRGDPAADPGRVGAGALRRASRRMPRRPTVVGEGWSAVVGASHDGRVRRAIQGLDPEQLGMLDGVTSAVDGGRVLQTSLDHRADHRRRARACRRGAGGPARRGRPDRSLTVRR